MRDIYDPPPAALPWTPPRPEPLRFSAGDLAWLGFLICLLAAATIWAATIEATLVPCVLVGGLFVILESWFSALTYLHRHPDEAGGGRWRLYFAALVPWAIGLGVTATLMVGLFTASDWLLLR